MYKATQTYDNDGVSTITIDCDGDIESYTDEMEPEDATFYRDLCWIISELERAYEQGCEDGYEDGYHHGHETGYNEGYDSGSLVFDDD